jgi:hypothetical protein
VSVPKLKELQREAQQSVERADDLRKRLAEHTDAIDDLVVETRATLRRAVAVLEREGLRGHRSGTCGRIAVDREKRRR